MHLEQATDSCAGQSLIALFFRNGLIRRIENLFDEELPKKPLEQEKKTPRQHERLYGRSDEEVRLKSYIIFYVS